MGVHTRPDFPDASRCASAQPHPWSLTFPKHQCSCLSEHLENQPEMQENTPHMGTPWIGVAIGSTKEYSVSAVCYPVCLVTWLLESQTSCSCWWKRQSCGCHSVGSVSAVSALSSSKRSLWWTLVLSLFLS